MKERKPKDLVKNIRGVSASVLGFGGGVTFVRPPEERDIALKLFAQLADRRILFHGSCHVVHQDMIDSLKMMRDNITAAIEQIPESAAVLELTRIRKICHDFQALVEAYYNDDPNMPLQCDFHHGLNELRDTVGQCLYRLSVKYDIAVDSDLARIMPKEPPNQALFVPSKARSEGSE